MSEIPLQCKYQNGRIVIEIGEEVLAHATIGDKGPHQTLHINAQFLRQYSEQAALDAGKEQ